MRHRLLIASTALCVALATSVWAEEVLETWPDGTPKSRQVVDENGIRNGASVSYYENGRVHIEAVWRDGKRHGVQATHAQDGRLVSVIHFAKGVFNGPYKTFDDHGTLRLRKHYRNGALHGAYSAWSANGKPELKAAYKSGLLDGRYEAYDRAGVLKTKAKYKAGKLNGTYEAFENRRRVSKQSWSMGHPTNVDGVVPFPSMKRTGFGHAKNNTAMYALDRSGSDRGAGDLILYPPAGYVPQRWFGARQAWSIWVRSGYRRPDPATVKVVVQPVGADFLPTGAALKLDHLRVSEAHYGIRHRIVFRPAGLDVAAGKQYRVTVSGLVLMSRPATLRYYVAFFHAAHGPEVPRAQR